nr:hypothetical protein Iba_chr13eCG8790 [Ipomoea batatas]
MRSPSWRAHQGAQDEKVKARSSYEELKGKNSNTRISKASSLRRGAQREKLKVKSSTRGNSRASPEKLLSRESENRREGAGKNRVGARGVRVWQGVESKGRRRAALVVVVGSWRPSAVPGGGRSCGRLGLGGAELRRQKVQGLNTSAATLALRVFLFKRFLISQEILFPPSSPRRRVSRFHIRYPAVEQNPAGGRWVLVRLSKILEMGNGMGSKASFFTTDRDPQVYANYLNHCANLKSFRILHGVGGRDATFKISVSQQMIWFRLLYKIFSSPQGNHVMGGQYDVMQEEEQSAP